MPLELVPPDPSAKPKQTYDLPPDWERSIENWLRWLRLTGISANSIKLRRSHIRVIARRSKTEHPGMVDLAMLVELCGNAGWSNDYRKSMRSSLVSYFEWAVSQKLTHVNPAEGLPRVPESKPNPKPATDSVWFEALEKATPRLRLMVRLAGEAGMRRAEVACCHYDDLLEDINGFSLIVHGKGGKQRVVPITDSLARAIKEHCGSGYLFPAVDKWGHIKEGHLTPEYIGVIVGKLMPKGWTMHKLRHRYATRGHAGTGNLRAVQEALGHVSVATTQKYVAVAQRDIRAVSEAAYKPTPEMFTDTV
jgi:integrase